MRVLRISVVEFAEDRFPLVRIVVREMRIPFHFCVNVGQVELLCFWQELLVNTTPTNHHNLFRIATGGNRVVDGFYPFNAIVRARLATDDDVFTTR
ncbi:hypothetical protein D3C71_1979440 [compost metagenome]